MMNLLLNVSSDLCTFVSFYLAKELNLKNHNFQYSKTLNSFRKLNKIKIIFSMYSQG